MSLPRNKQLQNNFSFFAAVYLLFSDVNATKDDDNDTVPPQLMSSLLLLVCVSFTIIGQP